MQRSAVFLLPFLLAGFFLMNNRTGLITPTDVEDQTDGPYVLYKKNRVFADYVLNTNGEKWVRGDTVSLEDKQNLTLHINTGIPGQSFSLKMKHELVNEESEFGEVEKLLAVSDVEGDFRSFYDLLRASGVIDENFNWTFGDGHLVLTGDFVDRGRQVTEVLWLIYSLEEKAKAAGGYVHFILGNHEIMNLSGYVRYVNKKYFENAKLLHKSYERLFSKNSEIGRWLLTKNIVEKIGKRLFLHGGISSEVNDLHLNSAEINQLARRYYNIGMSDFQNQSLKTIFSSKLGPHWYRGYFKEENRATPEQIYNTLSGFNVSEIICGHTAVSEKITYHYGGKVINLDTHDYHGNLEALLIENGKYYGINTKGEKHLIFG